MEFFTKLKPLTSQTKEWPFARRRSKPQTVCWFGKTLWDKKNFSLSFITRSYWQNTVFFFCVTHLKCNTHFSGHKLLHCGEHHRIADLLPLTVSLHFPIQSRRLTGFGVSVIRSDSVNLQHPSGINKLPGHTTVLSWHEIHVYLNISAICGHELLVDVRSSLTNGTFWRIHTAPTANLQKGRFELHTKQI